MGTSLPRAVPLDAVVAALSSVVDGAVVFRVAVVGMLLLAGWGAHRLLAGAPTVDARAVLTAVAAVWNPYVVERLALGQWALLAWYAALWWLLPAVRRVLAGDRTSWSAVVAAACSARSPRPGRDRARAGRGGRSAASRPRRAGLVLLGLASQLPGCCRPARRNAGHERRERRGDLRRPRGTARRRLADPCRRGWDLGPGQVPGSLTSCRATC